MDIFNEIDMEFICQLVKKLEGVKTKTEGRKLVNFLAIAVNRVLDGTPNIETELLDWVEKHFRKERGLKK